MNLDYGEILCEAMDMVATKIIQNIKYDTTKLYTIIDNSLAHEGKYKVGNAEVTFYAFTPNLKDFYEKDEQVYVCIPEGDYNQQKIIVGRKMDQIEGPYRNISPFKEFVDLEGVTTKKDMVWSLTANYGEDFETIKVLDHKFNIPIEGYSRLGIAANFMIWFSTEVEVFRGNYGLIINLYDGNDSKVGNFVFDCQDMIGNIYNFYNYGRQEILFDISRIKSVTRVEGYFYQLNNFYTLENNYVSVNKNAILLQDQEPKNKITDCDNFFVKDIEVAFGKAVNEIGKEELKLSTLDSITYKDNDPQLVRTVNLRWIHQTRPGEYIVIRDYNDIISNRDLIENLSQYDFRWYHYTPGAQAEDKYGETQWDRINKFLKVYNKGQQEYYQDEGVFYNKKEKQYYHNFIPYQNYEEKETEADIDANKDLTQEEKEIRKAERLERIKDGRRKRKWLELDGYIEEIKTDSTTKFNTSLYFHNTNIPYPPLFSYTFAPNAKEKNEEKIKVILLKYNEESAVDEIYKSEPIVFINEVEVTTQVSNQSQYGLSIVPNDTSNGNYYIYELSNNSITSEAKKSEKILECYFSSAEKQSENVKLELVSDIKWYIPRNNSMLIFDSLYKNKFYTEEELKQNNVFATGNNENYLISFNEIYGYVDENGIVSKYYKYLRKGERGEKVTAADHLPYYIDTNQSTETTLVLVPNKEIPKISTELKYKISSSLRLDYSNNTIVCIVNKDGKEYRDYINFNFGYFNSSGGKTSLILSYETEEGYDPYLKEIDTEDSNNKIKIIARLYDKSGKEIPYSSNYAYSFERYKPNDDEKITLSPENNCCIIEKNTLSLFDSNQQPIEIIACKLSGYENYDLTAYIGIDFFNNSYSGNTYTSAQGLNKIIYTYNGEALYSNQDLCLVDNNNFSVYPAGLKWRIITDLPKDEPEKLEKFNGFIPYVIVPPLREEVNKQEKNITPRKDCYYVAKYLSNGVEKEDTFLGTEKQTFFKYYNMSSQDSTEILISLERVLLPQERQWKVEVPEMYLENSPKIALQAYSYNDYLQKEIIYYQRPIVVIRNSWFSSVIDEWNGENFGITSTEAGEGRLMSKAIVAGSKDDNNKFTGIILGDWREQDGNSDISTGLYGFEQGDMSFYFKNDGTAAIGKSGRGQLSFNGNDGTIQSGAYIMSNGEKGMEINFTDGIVQINGNSATNSIIIDGSLESINSQSTFPFKIGQNFKVAWDGTIYANNGVFNGQIRGADIDFSQIFIDIQSSFGNSWERLEGRGFKVSEGIIEYFNIPEYNENYTYLYYPPGSDRLKGEKIEAKQNGGAEQYDNIVKKLNTSIDEALPTDFEYIIEFYDTLKNDDESRDESLQFRKENTIVGRLGYVKGLSTDNIGIKTIDSSVGIMFDSSSYFKAAGEAGVFLQMGDDGKKQLKMTQDSFELVGYNPNQVKGFYAQFG